ncbi:ATP-dependent DNA helicase RecG [Kocuria palustris]|uniref:ATP-dependent DNA helicase RecG n=1 Tax=Kocuria palustris TaxID=71999 RepID=UPI00119D968C|nr:ATP-dependent DNA helicase RecG [Kocuria palustris]
MSPRKTPGPSSRPAEGPAGGVAVERGDLDRPLSEVLGGSTASAFSKHLGVTSIGQLLEHFPRRLVPRGELTSFDELRLDEHATLVAEVLRVSTRRMRSRSGSITEVVITDRSSQEEAELLAGATGATMTLSFFNAWTAARDLLTGTHALFSGKVTQYRGELTMTNPHYAPLDPGDDADAADALSSAGRPVPVYPAVAKLTGDRIAQAVQLSLAAVDWSTVPDPLPPEIARAHGYSDLRTAYGAMHRPADEQEWHRAKARFRHTEALILQAALLRRRRAVAQRAAPVLTGAGGRLLAGFGARLPFALTASQQAVGEQIARDLAAEHPMNRLLQGDVGSGKTVVALRAMLQAVDSGAQAVLLAPTEVLAAQHHASITRALGPLGAAGTLDGDPDGTRVVLLTGSMPAAARKRAMLEIITGEAGIVIGTHALLSDTVEFSRLGLVVIDEQHRFGVEQRDRLRESGTDEVPHLLVMTATPIPRTVAMTVFGDLDVSVLEGLPAGRRPIETHVVGLLEHPAWERRIMARAAEEIAQGRQVYVVAPKIGADDEIPPFSLSGSALDDRAAETMVSTSWLEQIVDAAPELASVRTAVLHGRLDGAEKSAVMEGFAAGEIDLLICTTVVEVGVDVPNATLMVIADADRFGISQLHQLRGRIGRGGHASTCLLVTRRGAEHPSRERIAAVAATTDGFELAQADLAQRREGDILGDAQSGGRSTLRLLRAVDDAAVIEKARSEAQSVLDADPDLQRHPELLAAIRAALDEDTEKYLERG